MLSTDGAFAQVDHEHGGVHDQGRFRGKQSRLIAKVVLGAIVEDEV